jgi:hypothetical protein
MLSAASVALMAGTAWAAGPTDITTILTAPIKTSVDGNTTIKSGGGVNISAIGPAVTIDSSNFVSLENGGKITNKDKDGADGIVIDATGGDLTITPGNGVGGGTSVTILNIAGAMDLTGTGITKKAILLTGGHTITGDIFMLPSTTINVTGDGSNALQLVKGTTLIGNITTDGKIVLNQTTANATSDSGLTAVSILGNMTGNFTNVGTISSIGQNAQGVLIGLTDLTTTDFMGAVINKGTIGTGGTSNRSSSQTNPEGGSALIINRNVTKGVYNAGPVVLSDGIVAGTITSAGASPAVLVTPTLANITLGIVPDAFKPASEATLTDFGFINRGTISAVPVDNNVSAPIVAARFGGNASFTTTIAGGIFNSGSIQAQSVSAKNANTPLVAVSAYGLILGQGTNTPKLVNTGISSGGSSGVIQAAVGGPANASIATALVIDVGSVTSPTVVPEILNLAGGQIVASASTTDTTNTALTAIGIEDFSGQVAHIRNEGKIVAIADALDGGTQTAIAIDAAVNRTVGLKIENGFDGGPGAQFGGTITGDINLGQLDDEIDLIGFASNNASIITGNISFGNAAALDKLLIGNFSTVTGAVTSQAGNLDVSVATGGTLNLLNNKLSTPVGMKVHNLTVDAGGALNLTISQGLLAGAVLANNDINLAHGATFTTSIGSFITNTGNFILLDAPTGHLTIPDANLYISAFHTPFLFTGSMCTNNVDAAHGGSDIDATGTDCVGNPTGSTHSQLILTLNQKTAAQLQLKGYASLPVVDVDPAPATTTAGTLYDLVNHVLPFDDALGAAVIQGVNSNQDAQKVYDAFAPFVSGGSRAIAVSLTDQATGPIGSRQRVLREYGKQPGDSTLWGIEFAQFLKDPGQTLLAGGTAYPAGGTLPGFKDHGFGFSIGGDGGSARDGWFGGALTFYTGDIGEIGDRNGQTQSEWYQLSGYSDWRGRGLFLDTNIDVGVTQYKGKRNIVIDTSPSSTFSRTALNKHTGVYLAGGLTTGAILKYGATTITPKIAFDGLTMRENGYTETGGGPVGGDGFDLAVGPSYSNSLRAFVGADLRQDVDVGSFFLQPEARIGYRYDFLSDPQKVTANFVTLPDNPFTITGPDPSQGNIVAGASLAASTDTWSLGVSFDWVRGSNGATQQAGQFHLVGRI